MRVMSPAWAALDGLRLMRLEFLHYKALVVKDCDQLAEIARLRAITIRPSSPNAIPAQPLQ